MRDSGYFLIGMLLFITGILLIFFGLKGDAGETLNFTNHGDSATKGYIAMFVIGAISLVISLILFIVAFRKFRENEKKKVDKTPKSKKSG